MPSISDEKFEELYANDPNTGEAIIALTYFQRKRIEFIEFNLYWFGMVSRADLIGQFPIAINTAKSDFALYKNKFGGKIVFKHGVGYKAEDGFQPLLIEPTAEELLLKIAQDQGVASPYSYTKNSEDKKRLKEIGVSKQSTVTVHGPPELQRWEIVPDCLRHIVRAIQDELEIEVSYRTPNKFGEQRFWVAPHSLTNDAFRWALRGYRYDHLRYGDVVLDRVKSVDDMRETQGHSEKHDIYWHSVFDVVIAPNPKLPSEAKRHIELQYNMSNGRLNVPVRKCFIPYFLKRYQIEEKSEYKSAHQEPLVVLNREEVTRAMPPHMRIPPET